MSNTEINLTPTATLLEIVSSFRHKIPCRTWGIASESNAGIVLIHGLGGHAGWFEALSRRLKIKHIFVLSYDLVGFGKQKNKRYLSYRQWLEDTTSVCAYLRSVMPDKPLVLLGNSMGALVALASCQSVKPNGLALLAPAFAGHPNIFSMSYQLPHLFKAIANPKDELILPYSTDLIAKEEQVKSWLDTDPARRRAVPGKMLLDLFFLTQQLRWQRTKLDCPLFMLTAGKDNIVDNRVSELMFRHIISPNKKKIVFPEAMHDLALDPAVDKVTDLLADWMNTTICLGKQPHAI